MKQTLYIILLAWLVAPIMAQVDCESINFEQSAPDYSNAGPTVKPGTGTTLPPNPSQDVKKIVHFVHGLGGTAESWANAANFTESSADVKTFRPEYSQSPASNFWTATDDLKKEMEDIGTYNTIPVKDRFLIGHSQGGLVGRSADFDFSNDDNEFRSFEGIVTFGTPHLGAAIADNIDLLLEEADNAFLVLGLPILLENIEIFQKKLGFDTDFDPIEILIEISQTDEKLEDLGEAALGIVSDLVAKKIIPVLLQKFIAGTVNEIGVETITTHEWFDKTSDYPSVAFYGIEEHPQFLRFLFSLQEESSNNPGALMSATEDTGFMDSVEVWSAKKYSKFLEYEEAAQSIVPNFIQDIIIEIDPYLIGSFSTGTSTDLQEIADAYFASFEWLVNLNGTWMNIIGANGTTTNLEYYCVCTDEQTGEELEEGPFDDPPNCGSQIGSVCETNIVMNSISGIQPNDAVVLVDSQTGFPGVDAVSEMPACNHSQERNSEETLISLSELFLGVHHNKFRIH